MYNLVVLPLLIPVLCGLLMGIFRKSIAFQKCLSLLSFLLTGAAAFYLVQQVSARGIQILELGGWQAPFGIVLVVDMLAALLLAAASLVNIACLLFAFKSIGPEREKYYFYPFLQFLIAGVNGCFLTGDLFNLYVCFEVMLVASYVLLSLGGSKPQLSEGIKYVVINVISSTLFLIAIGYLYGVLGTLNMAHLSLRIAAIGQTGLVSVIAILLLIVFSLKAALFLYFWLPGAYGALPPAIATIFAALLTKVGIYAIMRMFSLVFYHQPQITHDLLAVMAVLTMIIGGIGAVAHGDIRNIAAYNVVIGVGFVVFGWSVFTPAAVTGAIYYLIHDMLMKALLFMLVGTIIIIVGSSKLRDMSGMITHHPLLGWLFLITSLALTGIPPLSGFVGKYLIIQEGLTRGAVHTGYYIGVAVGLLSSLMILYSLIKIFVRGFWGETTLSPDMEKGNTRGLMLPCILLTVAGVFWGGGAELIYPYVEMAAAGLLDPAIYIGAVLGEVI